MHYRLAATHLKILHIGAKRKKAKAATETRGAGSETRFAAGKAKRGLRREDFCGAETDKKV